MIKGLKVLQLIDTLRPAGAETMAVSYANTLVDRVEGSFLGCTRMEGSLKSKLSPEVGYIFLERKNTLDFAALQKLQRFVRENSINLIHAHGTSYFLAVLLKICNPSLKLLWHDHFGERALRNKKPGILRPASYFFDGVICVNKALAGWAKNWLHTPRIYKIKNFVPPSSVVIRNSLKLKSGNTQKIICVANLRKEKDHLNLLKAFKYINLKIGNTSLHLVGKNENDTYFSELKEFIVKSDLEDKVHFYGQQENIEGLLKQASIGVLSSYTEGMPVALLEYGRAGLAVVCTDVGECSEIIEGCGKVVPAGNSEALAAGLLFYLEQEALRIADGNRLRDKVFREFTEETVLPEVLEIYLDIMD